jgi:hypothetical protein
MLGTESTNAWSVAGFDSDAIPITLLVDPQEIYRPIDTEIQ